MQPGSSVLIYDDAGDYAALQAAEKIAATGAKVEIMTRDRSFAPEVMAMSLTPSMRELQKRDVTFTVTWKLDAVRRDGNGLLATIGSDYGGVTRERRVDQVVVNHGTRPLDDIYFDLRPGSTNLGEVDYEALVERRPQTVSAQRRGHLSALPHWRRRGRPQHPRGDLRRAAAGADDLRCGRPRPFT